MSSSRLSPVQRLAYASLGAALIAVCSLISIPMTIPFTMQTFAVLLVTDVLGSTAGFLAVLAYLLLGAAGLPVFAGFRGGVSVLAGPTGGYLIGFLFSALVMGGLRGFSRAHRWGRPLAMAAALLVCYGFGTAWFMLLQARAGSALSVAEALGLCVIPYLLPDAAKLALACWLSGRLRAALRLSEG